MPNEDLGHKLTDKELAKLERRIAKLYREAGKELQATINGDIDQYEDMMKRKAAEVIDLTEPVIGNE